MAVDGDLVTLHYVCKDDKGEVRIALPSSTARLFSCNFRRFVQRALVRQRTDAGWTHQSVSTVPRGSTVLVRAYVHLMVTRPGHV